MKFLSKNAASSILAEGLTYQKNRDNTQLRVMLLAEQKNFCAYTEEYIGGNHSVEVEHFNSSLKFKDDYYNYYAVIRKANLRKKDERYKNAAFFKSLFFQRSFKERIRFDRDDLFYEEISADDIEAREFIDFLQLNSYELVIERKRHIERLKDLESMIPDWGGYFRRHLLELKFITAIEYALNIDLSEFYT